MNRSRQSDANALQAAACHLWRSGLNQGAEGNLSIRTADGILITPSGLPWESVQAQHMVLVNANGSYTGSIPPSSEWPLHRAIFEARGEVTAVVHTHSSFATTLACLRRDLPPFHYMIAVVGGPDVRCSRYATFGTRMLADAAVEALQDRKACLLASHGLVTVGKDLDEAVNLALTVEKLSEQYWRACQLGEPVLLSDAEFDDVMARFSGYGPQ